MIAGHFATGLAAYEVTRERQPAPIWLFLLAAMFLDFLMAALVTLGVERLEPSDFLDFSFNRAEIDMFISHDLLPVVVWAALFGIGVGIWRRQPAVALWCAGLVLFHELCDLVVGYPHDAVRGVGPVGLSLYFAAPVLGFLLEAAFSAAIVFRFCRRRSRARNPVSRRGQLVLYGLLVGTTLLTLPLATRSLNALFGLG